jgi:hypothetical protein
MSHFRGAFQARHISAECSEITSGLFRPLFTRRRAVASLHWTFRQTPRRGDLPRHSAAGAAGPTARSKPYQDQQSPRRHPIIMPGICCRQKHRPTKTVDLSGKLRRRHNHTTMRLCLDGNVLGARPMPARSSGRAAHLLQRVRARLLPMGWRS